ncbi:hypothetical protein L204_102979 [Cryptococcus depauperatus]|nr:hypothetical protein L204_00276 [Cryptococcus depauperatus CBS 7855]
MSMAQEPIYTNSSSILQQQQQFHDDEILSNPGLEPRVVRLERNSSKSAPSSPKKRLYQHEAVSLVDMTPPQLGGFRAKAAFAKSQAGPSRSRTLPSHPTPLDTAALGSSESSTGLSRQPGSLGYSAHFRHSSASSSVGNLGGSESISEEGFDSDATVRPGKQRYKHSQSQPDLTVLEEGKILKENQPSQTRDGQRRRDVEGWVGGVERGKSIVQEQQHSSFQKQPWERQRPSLGRTMSSNDTIKTIVHPQSHNPWLPAAPSRSPHSKSYMSLSSIRKSPSPRSAPLPIPIMSPISHRSNLSVDLSPKSYHHQPIATMDLNAVETFSSEGDDSSESGDSLTFVPKGSKSLPMTSELRQRVFNNAVSNRRDSLLSKDSDSVLGLSLESPTLTSPAGSVFGLEVTPKTVAQPLSNELEQMIRQSSLLYLRLLAVVPAVWGICVLVQALATGGLWANVWPYGVDLSKEALERLVAGGVMMEGEWIKVDRMDILLCISWAVVTGHFCFCLTTGLTHRWINYYSLPSTITRLASLQCLCWPATYLTLWVLGAKSARPLLAWVVIGVTTGWSRTVQMWVTSNVVLSGVSPLVSTNTLGININPSDSPAVQRRNSLLPGPPPDHLSAWEKFTWGRRWDWDAVAREVGWPVGCLLLITSAWLFWGIECGKWNNR